MTSIYNLTIKVYATTIYTLITTIYTIATICTSTPITKSIPLPSSTPLPSHQHLHHRDHQNPYHHHLHPHCHLNLHRHHHHTISTTSTSIIITLPFPPSPSPASLHQHPAVILKLMRVSFPLLSPWTSERYYPKFPRKLLSGKAWEKSYLSTVPWAFCDILNESPDLAKVSVTIFWKHLLASATEASLDKWFIYVASFQVSSILHNVRP